MLFFNKVEQTIANLERTFSTPALKAIVPLFIWDNGSEERQLACLREYLRSFSFCEVKGTGRNLGPGPARNRLIELCPYEWQLHIDNDIYVAGEDWLERIQEVIAAAGPSVSGFIPTLYNTHDRAVSNLLNASINHEGEIEISVANEKNEVNIFPGGASVLRKSMFFPPHSEPNLYDERYFVGYEDVDYCLTALKNGTPLALSPIRYVTLVHSHISSPSTATQESALIRYDPTVIGRSGRLLQDKFGSNLGRNWERWIQKQRLLSAQDPFFTFPDRSAGRDKSRLLVILDVRDWAFENIFRNHEASLRGRYEVAITYSSEATWPEVVADTIKGDYAIVLVFWRRFIERLNSLKGAEAVCAQCGMPIEDYMVRVSSIIWLTCIYDHLFLASGSGIQKTRRILHFADGYFVSSPRLGAIYRTSALGVPVPLGVVADGVDTNLYVPKNVERFDNPEKIVIGWVGNSLWGHKYGFTDAKGLKTILEPAIARAKADGLDVELRVIDAAVQRLPRDQVREFYERIHVLCCSSSVEGTPNPVLEAMACGVPILTTDVGIVRLALGPKQHQFIVERSPEAFASALRRLVTEPGLLRVLSNENISRRPEIDWANRHENLLRVIENTANDNRSIRFFEKLTILSAEIMERYCWLYYPDLPSDAERRKKRLVKREFASKILEKADDVPVPAQIRLQSQKSHDMRARLKFILLPCGRSGGKMLASMMCSNTAVIAHEEFSRFEREFRKSRNDIQASDYFGFAQEFLDRHPPNVMALAKQTLVNLRSYPEFVRFLGESGCPVLILDHTNLLDIAILRCRADRVAELSGVQRRSVREVRGPIPVNIQRVVRLVRDFRKTREELFSLGDLYPLRYFSITYDELVLHPEAMAKLAMRVLELPGEPNMSAFATVTPLNIKKAVANFTDLREVLINNFTEEELRQIDPLGRLV